MMEISIRPLQESDIPEADRIYRLAFGTFLNLPDPMAFSGDANHIRSRFLADPSAAYGAEVVIDGDSRSSGKKKLVGSNFTTNWSSVGFFGPLTIHPEFWDKGIAKRLLEPTIQLFSKWNTKHAGLFTFAQSPKHIALYQKFDFWPRFLTAVMFKDVISKKNNGIRSNLKWSRYSKLIDKKGELVNTRQQEENEKKERKYLDICSKLTNAIYDGLDVRLEIMSVNKQELGDTVLLWDDDNHSNDGNYSRTLVGFGVCHCGAGSEAGSNTCYIKFGAVKPGPTAGNNFDKLLDACETFAAEEGISRIVAGANTGRYEAYRKMLSRGFQTDLLGIAMQRYNESGYNRSNIYVIDDWR
jgi:GNAT superfamily N-acetyltransferase